MIAIDRHPPLGTTKEEFVLGVLGITVTGQIIQVLEITFDGRKAFAVTLNRLANTLVFTQVMFSLALLSAV